MEKNAIASFDEQSATVYGMGRVRIEVAGTPIGPGLTQPRNQKKLRESCRVTCHAERSSLSSNTATSLGLCPYREASPLLVFSPHPDYFPDEGNNPAIPPFQQRGAEPPPCWLVLAHVAIFM